MKKKQIEKKTYICLDKNVTRQLKEINENLLLLQKKRQVKFLMHVSETLNELKKYLLYWIKVLEKVEKTYKNK